MDVQETYGWSQQAANATGNLIGAGGAGGKIAGFLCVTAGSLKLTMNTSGGATIVDTMAVTAGIFYPIPLNVAPGVGVYFALTGGAAGTFFLNL